MQDKNTIGVYGLGAMGRNIALNIANQGFLVSVYNRDTEGGGDTLGDFLSQGVPVNLYRFSNVKDFVLSLECPRKVLIMVTAGSAVDEVIEQIMPYMDADDIVIDGGNSSYLDTQTRISKYPMRYLGCGISGGWYGALHGPSMMIGGSHSAWFESQEIFQAIAAKRDNQLACCYWFGEDGAGHFIKMVHNGIEYAMMQSIAESYDVLRRVEGLSNDDIASIFGEWNGKELNSYLMRISSEVLALKDDEGCLVDSVVDKSSQKGTGIDFSICSLKYGIPTPTIIAATAARFLSFSQHRKHIPFNQVERNDAKQAPSYAILQDVFNSIYCTYVVAFFQGMDLIQEVSKQQGWNIDLKEVASVWEAGCVIKAEIFKQLSKELTLGLSNQMVFCGLTEDRIHGLAKIIGTSATHGIPVPVFSSVLDYYYGISSSRLPAGLIQLQREYFGSHGFERIDNFGAVFHFSKGQGA